MKSIGEEKRIQALFHEMKLEDSGFTPSFAPTWNIAQAEFDRVNLGLARRQNPVNSLRLVTAILVISFVLTSLALWPRNSQINQPAATPSDHIAGQVPSDLVPSPERPAIAHNVASSPGGSRINRRSRKAVVRRFVNADRRVSASTARVAHKSALSSWQSPTATLLRLPGDELLRSLPELNQSTQELQRFLSSLN